MGPRSQFKLKFDHKAQLEYLEYTEDCSKNNQGGLAHRKLTPKISRAYENKDMRDRCVVTLYKKYLSLRPTAENCSQDFYLCPLTKYREDCWYSIQAMGINKLTSIVAKLAEKLGLEGRITNHSCRATCATRMYQNSCEEQLVKEKTGHRSDAVRSYKRTSESQMRNVSCILYGQESEEPQVKKPKVETVLKDPESTNVDVEGSGSSTSKISFNFTINMKK